MIFKYKKGITHGGTFHADEVFVTAAIRLLLDEKFVVERVFDVPEETTDDVFIYDIGHGKYDHHQKGGNGCRENGTPYASAGLFWRDFCPLSNFIKNEVDKNLVEGIDAIDNGFYKVDSSIRVASISSVISRFNPVWNNTWETEDEAFEKAVIFMITILENEIHSACAKEEARQIVEENYRYNSTDGIMLLQEYVPWQDILLEIDTEEKVLFVIYPSNRGGYNIHQVPKTPGSFEGRKSLPAEWAGLRGEELQKVTGIMSATFVHPGCFIGGADTLDDIREMAQLAIKA